jgi:hypothetical protein
MTLRRPLSGGATPILLSVVPLFEYTHASVPGVSETLSPAITEVKLPQSTLDLVPANMAVDLGYVPTSQWVGVSLPGV